METFIKYSDSGMGDNELVIDNVFVAITERGQGKGKQLVKKAINYAQTNNYKTVGLYAEPQSDNGLDSEALIEFYLSLGFVSDSDDSQLMTYTI
jgi:predicted GNAT family acetyltransferase